jgi:hypothetical protein
VPLPEGCSGVLLKLPSHGRDKHTHRIDQEDHERPEHNDGKNKGYRDFAPAHGTGPIEATMKLVSWPCPSRQCGVVLSRSASTRVRLRQPMALWVIDAPPVGAWERSKSKRYGQVPWRDGGPVGVSQHQDLNVRELEVAP